MTVLIFADSHGNTSRMESVVGGKYSSVNYIIHLGDLYRDAEKLQSAYPKKEIVSVKGNNDYIFNGSLKDELLIDLNGVLTYVLHGHTRGVNQGTGAITGAADAHGARLVLYGHTHTATEFWKNDTLFLNPGSITSPRNGKNPSFAVLDINNGKVMSDIVFVG